MIVEVLSPSTDQVDRWRKVVADYRSLPSVQEIVVVFSDERRVEVQRRTAEGWKVKDLVGQAALKLDCCAEPIPLEAVYRDLLSEHQEPAAGYGQFWGMRSGSGLVLGSDDGLAVAEADAADDLGETL